MIDTNIRKEYGIECLQCGLQLQNSMEQLVGLCPFCFRVDFIEKKRWVLNNSVRWITPEDEQITGLARFTTLYRANFRCQECDVTYFDIELGIDHVVPLVLGGREVENNLQVLCKKCKKRKGLRIWRAKH